MRIYIAVVSNRDHKAEFTGSLYALTQNLAHKGHEYGVTGHVLNIAAGHSCLSGGRQKALDAALKSGFEYAFFLDDDMVFPSGLVQMLLSKKVDVIGANYVMKTSSEQRFVAKGMNGERLSSKSKAGIEEVTRHGLGIMLMRLDAIRHIAAPHFEVLWDAKTKGYISEDNYFFDKLHKNNVKIYTDHDASQNIGHIGDYMYSLNSSVWPN